MPQLDPSYFSGQLFWLGVSFVILYLILSQVAIPRVQKIFDSRQQTMEEKLAKANAYRDQAEALLTDYEATLGRARGEAHERYRAVTQEVLTEMAAKQQAVLDTLQGRLHEEELALSQEGASVQKELQKVTVDVAAALLKKLTGRVYTAKEVRTLQEST